VLDPTVTQTGINIFTNGLNTRTRGAEFVLTASSDFDAYGSVQWSLTANYTKTKVTKVLAPPPQLAGASLFDRTALDQLETTSPKYRMVGGALWSLGPVQVNLKETLYGPASRYDSRTGCPLVFLPTTQCFKNKIDTTLITDLEISYKVMDSVKASIGANNLFNKYPDKLNAAYRQTFLTGNSNGYVTQYPTFSSFGINGGYWYGKISVDF
jgi:iron complex outermembrane recepter protein